MNVKATDFVFQTVTDFSTSVPFYRDTLGLEPELVDDENGWAEFSLPPTTLALGEESPQMPFTPGESGSGVAMAVDDVETATDELQDEGVTILMDPIDSGVCHMSIIADPDGNPISSIGATMAPPDGLIRSPESEWSQEIGKP
ncbi:glyoxalase/bleomycin resistance protein/dioxygenase [Natrialba taiwanensis DSM 12281]|uniref:Glyoxalase/bleomycin resistance protein/dioxygenase n=2 Tax=Natrialba taiwanensis TaxID=160846 RepID=M0ACN6_9EURY|nr:glyoxalase/bleomycin resistance protein/dioxygenase [Natrialba taiwanensis DSM 12281]